MTQPRVLLIISGGIAAYKSLEVIRRLKDGGAVVTCVLTPAAKQFVTPLSVATLSGRDVHSDLFEAGADAALAHISLARDADLVLVAPATADLLARMAHGLANDLATAVVLAAQAPVLVAPAMNPAMWSHPATRANVHTLRERGVHLVGPDVGVTACAEEGVGRMAQVDAVVEAVFSTLRGDGAGGARPLCGRKAIVTSGPTVEPIDPVRFLSNHSSGRQGRAIAGALARLGAEVMLISGPDSVEAPAPGVTRVAVTTARSMLSACEAALPVDVAVCAAAVADWRVSTPSQSKLKKQVEGTGDNRLTLSLEPNPDILASIARPGPRRPKLVVGFAAETENVVENATAKRVRKQCDWVVANDVSINGNGGRGSPFGGSENTVHLITASGCEDWPTMSKEAIASLLADRIANALTASPTQRSRG